MNNIKSHKDLIVWQKAIDFVVKIYSLSDDFPKSELYGLTNQMRRAAVSIPSNIAEGSSRKSRKEFIQFLYIASGSASELETQLIIAEKLNYFQDSELFGKIIEIRKMLSGLISSLKTNH